MNMVKSHLLSRNTLSSTIIGVIPREPVDEDKVTMWPYFQSTFRVHTCQGNVREI